MKDVVIVHNYLGSGGTGWVTTVKGKTYVITNGHVCGVAVDGMVVVNYRGEDYLVKVIGAWDKHDLCAVEAPPNVTGGFKIASDVVQGEVVYTLGHPYLEPNTITKGELSGLAATRIQIGQNLTPAQCSGEGYELIPSVQINPFLLLGGIENICIRTLTAQASPVTILPGNSGSPTVNIYGNVVAVAYAANEFGTRSYHVPLEFLKEFLGNL